jgi:hypothetical protein
MEVGVDGMRLDTSASRYFLPFYNKKYQHGRHANPWGGSSTIAIDSRI